jgi:hypothetical protein
MHDAGKIIPGLLIFLAIITSPVWYRAMSRADAGAPQLTMPAGSQECVEETSYMRSFHMDLLNEWRDSAVRTLDVIHVGPGGKKYLKSFAGTCMDCHSQKAEFCDRCHAYVGAEPYCWDCHAESEGAGTLHSSARTWGP